MGIEILTIVPIPVQRAAPGAHAANPSDLEAHDSATGRAQYA